MDIMDKIHLGYSTKNIPIQGKYEYLKDLTKNIEWKALVCQRGDQTIRQGHLWLQVTHDQCQATRKQNFCKLSKRTSSTCHQ